MHLPPWLMSPGTESHRDTFHTCNSQTFCQTETLEWKEGSLCTEESSAVAFPKEAWETLAQGDSWPWLRATLKGIICGCVSTCLCIASFVSLFWKEKVSYWLLPAVLRAVPVFKNTLSFDTKESHVKWLFTTAVAMTDGALKHLLSDADRKKRNPIDKPF